MIFSKLWTKAEEIDAELKKYFDSEKAKIESDLSFLRRLADVEVRELRMNLQNDTIQAEKELSSLQGQLRALYSTDVNTLAGEKDKVIASLQIALTNLSERIGEKSK